MALLGKPLKGEASAGGGGGGESSQQRGRPAPGSQAEREYMEKLAKEDLQQRLAAATRKQLKVRCRSDRSNFTCDRCATRLWPAVLQQRPRTLDEPSKGTRCMVLNLIDPSVMSVESLGCGSVGRTKCNENAMGQG